MAKILRSSFSPSALMRIPKPSVKMTKILEQLFNWPDPVLQSLLDLMGYQNRDRRNQPSALLPEHWKSRC
jgi:hypothetical protein